MANKSHTESTEITDIKRPSQMADKGHTDTTESTEMGAITDGGRKHGNVSVKGSTSGDVTK